MGRVDLLKQTNDTMIALAPKTNHSSFVGDYRKIACCKPFQKVITKIFASLLGSILGYIVDQTQVAFVEGRAFETI